MGIYSLFISDLYPICTSRNEVQNCELSLFLLQHSATYSYTLLHKATNVSSNIRIQRIGQHREKNLRPKPKPSSQSIVVMIKPNASV